MTIAATRYEHIILDHQGVPVISGTTMKVIELVLEQEAHGWSAEELRFQHPYLSLGQIHSALAYYWDHKLELDHEIADRLATVEQLRLTIPPPPLLTRIKNRG